jgi:hypothetical protein
MQRRAAAVSAAFFLVIAAGAYALIGAAAPPEVSLDDADIDYRITEENETFTVDGVEYEVTGLKNTSATAAWTNESAVFTATLENNSSVAYRDANYTVLIPNESDPGEFRLREEQSIDRPTVTQNGTTYVVVESEGDNRTLVPRSEYLPDPETHTFAEGDEFEYQGNATTVAAIERSAVTLEWEGERRNTVDFEDGGNATLGDDRTFVAHFPSNGTLAVSSNYEAYRESTERVEFFHERVNGLWAVVITSGLAAALLVGMAYLPSRY